ncbi:hotdog domain-containing protein [Nocardioides sp. NPDC047086]|uniref:hotdog domain-containing protein n=1 Tax=Nocardioides sp. NPDC047086 TaxID=3154810 RepID=UPI0033DFD72F
MDGEADGTVTDHAEPWETRIGVPESFTGVHPDKEPSELPGGKAWAPLIEALRGFLDDLAGSLPDQERTVALTREVEKWSTQLRQDQVPETLQAFGHRVDLDGRGQVMVPAFVLTGRGPDSVEGTVTFGRYFLGGHGAVHGGAVALLFDEVLGRLSDTSSRPPGRTANLTVNYRAVTQVGKPLTVRAHFEEESGRKRYLVGEIWDGETLCADARALFLGLRAGQD